MGRDESFEKLVVPERVVAYLRQIGYADARLIALEPLGGDVDGQLKGFGYGQPLLITLETAGQRERLVIRTMSPDPFGHNRRADRAYQMVLSFDTFASIPRHIEPRDVGAFGPGGEMVSVPAGEFFLLTNFVDGELYATDLRALVGEETPSGRDLDRVCALAHYLADLHRRPADPAVYRRNLRDTVGTGEGIFGQIDGYPAADPVATAARLQAIELSVVRWRWKLRDRYANICVTHGDFHPYNILFREGADFSVLDCSRGGVGDAADDVTCMAINFLFFALTGRGEFVGAMRVLWGTFWRCYLEASGRPEVLEAVAPYFTWRALVLASPVWYPGQDAAIRDRLLTFCERLLADHPFDPERVDELLR